MDPRAGSGKGTGFPPSMDAGIELWPVAGSEGTGAVGKVVLVGGAARGPCGGWWGGFSIEGDPFKQGGGRGKARARGQCAGVGQNEAAGPKRRRGGTAHSRLPARAEQGGSSPVPRADTGRGGVSQADRGSGRKARPALTLVATHASPPPAGAHCPRARRSGSETYTVGSPSPEVVGAQQALQTPSHHVGMRGRGSCRRAHRPHTRSAPVRAAPWVPRSHREQTRPCRVLLADCSVGLRMPHPPCFRKRFPV